ncbi:uncharacterized protein LOC134277712 [Saccostrea cucullata]|uniref:uncharacterized protein LOC134277712 n=1 Tax=Saccostrea cuccullata TaxID=36930 RepID=UPI002ED42373
MPKCKSSATVVTAAKKSTRKERAATKSHQKEGGNDDNAIHGTEEGINEPVSSIGKSDYLPTPIVSITDALGCTIPFKTREKIQNGEYLDLGVLLETTEERDKKNKINLVDGELVLQKGKSRKITDIGKWTDAFLVFTSIYVEAHPDQSLGLLKYMHTIRLGSYRSPTGWKLYDEQFRLKKARNSSMEWGQIDNELWMLYVTSPVTIPQKTVEPSKGMCFDFNYKGACSKPYCIYAHRCIRCASDHPMSTCPRSPAPRFPMQKQPFRFQSPNQQPRPAQTPNYRFRYPQGAKAPRSFSSRY